jgi:hypothetical protein
MSDITLRQLPGASRNHALVTRDQLRNPQGFERALNTALCGRREPIFPDVSKMFSHVLLGQLRGNGSQEVGAIGWLRIRA